MTRNERLITWGLLALIAYELWPSSPFAAADRGFQPDHDSPLPTWIQNVSYAAQEDTTTDTITSLLSVPQGPGGTYVYPPPGGDYFNPVGGLCGQAVQQPALVPQVFRVA
jgi:hypothetical protein